VGTRQNVDLAELADWVEGLRAAAHTARIQGKVTLAEALDITRFEVYQGYLDEELDHNRAKQLLDVAAKRRFHDRQCEQTGGNQDHRQVMILEFEFCGAIDRRRRTAYSI
jgi:hypothetical protein